MATREGPEDTERLRELLKRLVIVARDCGPDSDEARSFMREHARLSEFSELGTVILDLMRAPA